MIKKQTYESLRGELLRTALAALLPVLAVLTACFGLVPATALAEDVHTHDGKAFEATNALPTASGSYYLSDDVTLSGTWFLDGIEVSLCLNGHTIKVENASAETDAIRLANGAKLNLYDCGNAGTITHADGSLGRGVYVAGNSALNLCDGTIATNTATGNGAGVYVSAGSSLSVSGGVCVEGNVRKNGVEDTTGASNVYLSDDCTIAVTGALSAGASLGVSMANPGVFTSGYGTSAAGVDPSTYFSSDDDGYAVQWNAAGAEATFGKLHSVRVSDDGNGTAEATPSSATSGTTVALSANSYIVAFRPNEPEYAKSKSLEVTGTMPDQAIAAGTDTQLAANAFAIRHYAFAGWNTKADGTGVPFKDEELVRDLASAGDTVELYAQWTPETYTVTFDANGGTGTMQPQDFVYGVTDNLNPNKFSRSGYAFASWNTKADGSGSSFKNKASVNLSRDVTLYAQWSVVTTCSISFKANGGSGTMDAQVIAKGVISTLKANEFTRSGYAFVGWNTQSDGSGTSYADGAKIKPSHNMTLYARWTVASYCTVTFKANGGKGTMAKQTFTKGVSTKLKTNKFTRANYYFTKWNTKADGSGTSIRNGAMVTVKKSTVLYAQWRRGLPKPRVTTTPKAAKKKIVVRWGAISNAKKYQVQWRVKDGSWKARYVEKRKTTIAWLDAGGLYQVRVRAIYASKAGSWSTVYGVWLRKGSGVRGSSAQKGAVKVSWSKTEDATGYIVRVRYAKSGKVVATKTVKGGKRSVTIKGLERGKKAWLSVTPVRKVKRIRYVGAQVKAARGVTVK